MNKQEEVQNLLQALLNRNAYNQSVIRKYYKKTHHSKKSVHSLNEPKAPFFPLLTNGQEKFKQQLEKTQPSLCEDQHKEDLQSIRLPKKIENSNIKMERDEKKKEEAYKRSSYKKDGSYDGFIINEKAIVKFMKRKPLEEEQKKRLWKRDEKKYESQKALLNLKDIIFSKDKEGRRSECSKKKTESESSKVLAFGNRRVVFKIKNHEVLLPPMKLNANFQFYTVDQKEEENYSDRYIKVKAIPLSKMS